MTAETTAVAPTPEARPMDLLGIRANIDKAGIAIREGTWQDDC